MPDRAKVTSLEAIEAFRAKLVIYRDKAARVLDEVSEEVVRTRGWLENDRQMHWHNQIRRLTRELEQRQQELFSVQLSDPQGGGRLERAALQKTRRALDNAEEHSRVVRQWIRQYDQRVEPLARHVEKLRHHLGHDLAIALAYLVEVTKTLSAYAELSPTGAALPPSAASSESQTEQHSSSSPSQQQELP
jgi:hypothetical protein